MRFSFILLSIVALVWGGEENTDLMACECDAPSCPAGRLDTGSLCACLNNAAMFCWYRNNKSCARPVLQACGAQGATGTISVAAPPPSTYTPPYQGNGGLNCVEVGYCSRPTKAKTSMTVTVSGVATVITVAVGLPTPELSDLLPGGNPNPTAAPGPPADAPLVFTTIPAPTPAPTPELSDLLPPPATKRSVAMTTATVQEWRQKHNRWIG